MFDPTFGKALGVWEGFAEGRRRVPELDLQLWREKVRMRTFAGWPEATVRSRGFLVGWVSMGDPVDVKFEYEVRTQSPIFVRMESCLSCQASWRKGLAVSSSEKTTIRINPFRHR